MCNSKADKPVEESAVHEPQVTVVQEAEEPNIDGAATEEGGAQPTAEKPGLTGEMPDTSKKVIIEHGAPDKARNDSVKAAKTKGKF